MLDGGGQQPAHRRSHHPSERCGHVPGRNALVVDELREIHVQTDGIKARHIHPGMVRHAQPHLMSFGPDRSCQSNKRLDVTARPRGQQQDLHFAVPLSIVSLDAVHSGAVRVRSTSRPSVIRQREVT